MKQCLNQGAIVFAVIEFAKRDIRFFVPADVLLEAWYKAVHGGQKSIPFELLDNGCYTIPARRGVLVDYLSIVDKLLKNGIKGRD